MQKMMKGVFALVIGLFMVVGTAQAADKAATAKTLVDKAISFYEANGFEKSQAAFNDKTGQFVEGEFYVIMAMANDGIFKAHPINGKLIDNAGLKKLKDINGIVILDSMVKAGMENAGNGAWSEYTWTNPATKKLAPKKTWVKKKDDYLFMVGYYE